MYDVLIHGRKQLKKTLVERRVVPAYALLGTFKIDIWVACRKRDFASD